MMGTWFDAYPAYVGQIFNPFYLEGVWGPKRSSVFRDGVLECGISRPIWHGNPNPIFFALVLKTPTNSLLVSKVYVSHFVAISFFCSTCWSFFASIPHMSADFVAKFLLRPP